jgi:hypothetical protein
MHWGKQQSTEKRERGRKRECVREKERRRVSVMRETNRVRE